MNAALAIAETAQGGVVRIIILETVRSEWPNTGNSSSATPGFWADKLWLV